jgi:hypothetical protein
LNRASRTGPSLVMKEGRVFEAPARLAAATCGFSFGLDPPTAGCA